MKRRKKEKAGIAVNGEDEEMRESGMQSYLARVEKAVNSNALFLVNHITGSNILPNLPRNVEIEVSFRWDYEGKEKEKMSYVYSEQKPNLFTEDGMKHYIAVRDEVNRLLEENGAFTYTAIKTSGDSWLTQAALDYMIEQGELVMLRGPKEAWMQFWVYATPKTHNR